MTFRSCRNGRFVAHHPSIELAANRVLRGFFGIFHVAFGDRRTHIWGKAASRMPKGFRPFRASSTS